MRRDVLSAGEQNAVNLVDIFCCCFVIRNWKNKRKGLCFQKAFYKSLGRIGNWQSMEDVCIGGQDISRNTDNWTGHIVSSFLFQISLTILLIIVTLILLQKEENIPVKRQ